MAAPDAYAGLMLTRESVVFRNEFPNAPSVRDRGTECTVHRAEHSRRREVAKPGIALGSGARDRGFEPRLPDHSHMGSPSRPQPRARPPTRNPPELIQARKTTRSNS